MTSNKLHILELFFQKREIVSKIINLSHLCIWISLCKERLYKRYLTARKKIRLSSCGKGETYKDIYSLEAWLSVGRNIKTTNIFTITTSANDRT